MYKKGGGPTPVVLACIVVLMEFLSGGPKGSRTPVFGVRGRRPRPLDDGTVIFMWERLMNYHSVFIYPALRLNAWYHVVKSIMLVFFLPFVFVGAWKLSGGCLRFI